MELIALLRKDGNLGIVVPELEVFGGGGGGGGGGGAAGIVCNADTFELDADVFGLKADVFEFEAGSTSLGIMLICISDVQVSRMRFDDFFLGVQDVASIEPMRDLLPRQRTWLLQTNNVPKCENILRDFGVPVAQTFLMPCSYLIHPVFPFCSRKMGQE